MALFTGGGNFIRNVLYGFNFLFVLTGIVLISVGGAVQNVFKEYEIFLQTEFFSIPTLLIVTGVFIFMITIFGCFGAYKENYCLLLIFSILLGFIFILELSAGISGYVLRSKASDLIQSRLNASLSAYVNHDSGSTKLWDLIQNQFECCGVSNYEDWSKVVNTTVNKKEDLPLTCCKIPNGIIGRYNCTGVLDNRDLKSYGCLSTFSDYIASHAISLGAAGVIFAIVQFAAVGIACYIAREVKIKNGISGVI